MIKRLCLTVAAFLLVAGVLLLVQGNSPLAEATATHVHQSIVDAQGLKLSEKLPLLRDAREQQERGLQAELADPYAWSRLAALRRITQNDRAGELIAIRMAQQAAPYEPRVMVERAYAFYSLRDLHTEVDSTIMMREWRYVFLGDRKGLFVLLKKNPMLVTELDKAMKDDKHEDWWLSERKKAGL